MDKNLLKAEIVKNGFTANQVAKDIGISECTFSRKLNSGNFGLDEVNKMISLLAIEEPEKIFFL